VREVRKQVKKHSATASPNEAEQLAVIDEYATGIVTALNTDGLQPFKYATVEESSMLEEIEASLQQLSKKGGGKPSGRAICWPACKPLWRNESPGQSNWRTSNACTDGCWKSSTSWTQAGHKKEKWSAMQWWEAAWTLGARR
jgi:hypothetical protein